MSGAIHLIVSYDLIKLYSLLPAFGKTIAASLRGYHLRSWRYGEETDRLVQEALARESWTPEAWTRWQANQLDSILDRAATKVLFYRDYWAKQRRMGNRARWSRLENWPVLEKDNLRLKPTAFLADDADARKMFQERTSGTSGKPLELWWSREAVRFHYALFEARVRMWNGVSRCSRFATLGGQLITPARQRKPRFWVWNAAMNQLYMSSYHLAPGLVPSYLEALQEYRVDYIFGYVSSLHALAQGILKSGRTDIRMKVAITNAEPLYSYQAQAISKAFGCPVRETYGNAEGVSAAAECSAGRLHLWPEQGIVEVFNGDRPAPVGTTGDLVFTGILNPMMPLIRYRIGDRGRLASSCECPCGRTLPILESIEGRQDDVLITSDGRQIGRLDPIFKTNLPIAEAQIIQETLKRIRIRYVPAEGYTDSAGQALTERLRERMGQVEVILEPVPEVPRELGGKFRAVICRLSVEERQRISNAVKPVKQK